MNIVPNFLAYCEKVFLPNGLKDSCFSTYEDATDSGFSAVFASSAIEAVTIFSWKLLWAHSQPLKVI